MKLVKLVALFLHTHTAIIRNRCSGASFRAPHSSVSKYRYLITGILPACSRVGNVVDHSRHRSEAEMSKMIPVHGVEIFTTDSWDGDIGLIPTIVYHYAGCAVGLKQITGLMLSLSCVVYGHVISFFTL
jgi:hypothetical protein